MDGGAVAGAKMTKVVQVPGGELVVLEQQARSIVGLVSDLVSGWQYSRQVTRQKIQELQSTAQVALREGAARGIGELCRINIEEIAKTSELISSLPLQGESRDMAMAHLRQLSEALERNLDEYTRFTREV